MTGKRGTPLERFERHYIPEPNSGCWLWIGSLQGKSGYGQMGMPGGRPIRAHRLAYQLFKGKIPKGLDVRHTCDLRCCVNPEHLLVGTRQQNMEDAVRRGRQARGFMLPHTKLSDLQITNILLDTRYNSDIAASYGITKNYVSILKSSNGVKSSRPPNKGSGLKRSNHPMAKLSEFEVFKIKKEYAAGKTQTFLSKKFKVTQTTIWRIVHGLGWK